MQNNSILAKLTILSLFLLPFLGKGQLVAQPSDDTPSTIGLYYSLSNGKLRYNEQSGIALSVQKVDGVGLTYLKSLTSTIQLESGVGYTLFRIAQISSAPALSDTTHNTLSLIEIPLLLRIKFAKILFLNGGVILDLDTHSHAIIPSQSGIGFMIGMGIAYKFGSGVSIFANPYLKTHNTIRFERRLSPNNLFETGIKLGVSYDFR